MIILLPFGVYFLYFNIRMFIHHIIILKFMFEIEQYTFFFFFFVDVDIFSQIPITTNVNDNLI